VRRPLEVGQVEALRRKIEELNAAGNLHIQLVTNEPRGFSGLFAYGSFSGVENYIVMAGKRDAAAPAMTSATPSADGETATAETTTAETAATETSAAEKVAAETTAAETDAAETAATVTAAGSHEWIADFDERIGYYGEELVLFAQQLGLGTCWAGLSYRKVPGTFTIERGEKFSCMISIGHPDDEGRKLKRKSVEDVSNVGEGTPEWFRRGVEAALKAPTAINQQKFRFDYLGERDGRPAVSAKATFSLVGYTRIDLGIAKLHFEIGAGRENFVWAKS
jgi:nitroreductase